MNELEQWTEEIKNEVEKQSEHIVSKDYNFFHISRFIEISKLIYHYSGTCTQCQTLKPEALTIARNLSNYINTSPLTRRHYDTKYHLLLLHLQQTHNIRIKGYIESVYIFLGLIVGIGTGTICGMFFGNIRLYIPLGFAFGMIIGKILGGRKERNIQKENRLL